MSYIEINISKAKLNRSGEIKPGWNGEPDYHHYFATAERSIDGDPNGKKFLEILAIFKETFPKPLYNISMTSWSKIGTKVNLDMERGEEILEPKEV